MSIEIPAIAWKPILHGFILRTRPRRSAEAYNQVWTNEGSPLAVIARRQAHALRAHFGHRVNVHYAMRYGNPGIAAALARHGAGGVHADPRCAALSAILRGDDRDCERRRIRGARRMRVQPALRTLPPYYDDPLYITALRANLKRQVDALDFKPERLLLSFHGMPQRTLTLGDPYHCHCQKTARLVSEALEAEVDVAFQSRFGRAKWLEPATDTTLAAYAKNGITRIAVAAPGFSADCLETLEELGIRGRETFLSSGGKDFALLDCLNDSLESATMLERLITRELAGWLPQS